MTENEAIEWVYDQDEEGDNIDADDMRSAFAALYGREWDDDDNDDQGMSMWTMCCDATPNCGTRPDES